MELTAVSETPAAFSCVASSAAKMAVLVKSPERVHGVCEHIVNHFREKVEPNGFKGMIVTFDRQCCDLYKKALDEITEEPELSDVVMSVNSGETEYDA